MQYRPTCGALSQPRYLSVAFGTDTTQKFLEKLIKKKSTFFGYGKYLSHNFSYWKNAYQRDFIQFSVRMELYGTV